MNSASKVTKLIRDFVRFVEEHGTQFQQRAVELQQAERNAQTILRTLEHGTLMNFYKLAPVPGLTVLAVCALLLDERILKKAQKLLAERNREAADRRHSGPGGSRAKRKAINDAWESGKYKTRDECAERMHAELGMSFSTARKALRRTAAPKQSQA